MALLSWQYTHDGTRKSYLQPDVSEHRWPGQPGELILTNSVSPIFQHFANVRPDFISFCQLCAVVLQFSTCWQIPIVPMLLSKPQACSNYFGTCHPIRSIHGSSSHKRGRNTRQIGIFLVKFSWLPPFCQRFANANFSMLAKRPFFDLKDCEKTGLANIGFANMIYSERRWISSMRLTVFFFMLLVTWE